MYQMADDQDGATDEERYETVNRYRAALGLAPFDAELGGRQKRGLYEMVSPLTQIFSELDGDSWNSVMGASTSYKPGDLALDTAFGDSFVEKEDRPGRRREALRFELHNIGTTEVSLLARVRQPDDSWLTVGPISDWNTSSGDEAMNANRKLVLNFVAGVLPLYVAARDARKAQQGTPS